MRTTLKTLLALFACLSIMVIVMAGMSGRAAAISLKTSSEVEGDMITLGDIFTGLPKDAEKVLGAAPRPGQEMVLNARTLMRIAIALDLPWRPGNATDTVIIRRAVSILSRDMIRDTVHNGLEDQGVAGKFEVALYPGVSDVILPKKEVPEAEIENISLRRDNNTFSATLAVPSKSNRLQTVKVGGSISRLVDVPVLRDTLAAGTIIGQRDINIAEIREKDINPGTVLKAEDLIGTTPKRMIPAGKPIKALDIEQPLIVERGDLVTMIYREGTLLLTAKGKAMENGAKGDVIRVTNPNSNKTIEAEVTAQNEVTVKTF